MSLRAKLFGAIGMTLCVVLGVLAAVTLVGERRRVARMEGLRAAALQFAANLAMATPPEGLQDTLLVDRKGRLNPNLRALGVYRRGEGGSLVRGSSFGALAEEDGDRPRLQALAERVFATGEPVGEGDAYCVPARAGRDAASPPTTVYVLEVARPPEDAVAASQLMFLVVVGSGVLLLVLTWFIVDRVVARPLSEVVRGANRVAEGDYGTEVPSSGGDDEIQKVITSFNTMMVELGALQSRMRDRTQDALLQAKKTQESLVIAQRLASTGQLAAGIAHEVNNPLAGMLNAVHALRTKELPRAKHDEYLEIVEDGLRRIQATVAKILQFRPHKVAPQPVDLDEVVRPVLALVRHRVEKEQVEVVVEKAPEPAVVFGDPYELQQALLNVVLNALDALEEAHRERPRIEIRSGVTPQEVHLQVSDNGIGMREEDVPRAFDLFFTTKEPGRGTGLGLATAHKILTDHGGRIDLRRRKEAGIEIEFVLPRFRG